MTVKEALVLKWVVIITVFCVAFFLICKINHVFTGKDNVKKAKKDIKLRSRSDFISRLVDVCLERADFFCTHLNGGLSDTQAYLWEYRLKRRPKKLPVSLGGRDLTYTEFVGIMKFISVVLTFLGLALIFVGTAVGCVIMIMGVLFPFLAGKTIDLLIQTDDDSLSIDFVNFYLAVLPQLRKGKDAKLAPIVRDYSKALEQLYPSPDDHRALKQFVFQFEHLLTQYATEEIAVQNLRSLYNLSDISTFCNYTIQALKGCNNATNLDSFQHDLLEKQKAALRAEGAKRAEIAQYAVYAVYIILVEVVLVCMLSKLNFDTSLFSFLRQDSGWSE